MEGSIFTQKLKDGSTRNKNKRNDKENVNELARITLNLEGSGFKKRKVIFSATIDNLILISNALEYQHNERRIENSNRKLIISIITQAYKRAPTTAIQVI